MAHENLFVCRVVLAGLLGAALPGLAEPAGAPRGEALRAWTAYESAVAARHASAPPSGPDFFVLDSVSSPAGWRAAARRGEVIVTRIEAPGAPGAAIHHWVGAVFVPGVALDRLLDGLQAQAGAEDRLYPDVLASRLLSRDGRQLRVFLKLRRTTIITVVYDTEHLVEYTRLASRRGASRSTATKIAEVADPGTPSEREKPDGTDHGFLWRMDAFWRYEETDGGVLVECESLSLSRGVPLLARPVASPIVNHVARESLDRTLQALRKALAGR